MKRHYMIISIPTIKKGLDNSKDDCEDGVY